MGNASLHSYFPAKRKNLHFRSDLWASLRQHWNKSNNVTEKLGERWSTHSQTKGFIVLGFCALSLVSQSSQFLFWDRAFSCCCETDSPRNWAQPNKQQHTRDFILYWKTICSVFSLETGPQCHGSSSGSPHHCWGGLVASVQGRSKTCKAGKHWSVLYGMRK